MGGAGGRAADNSTKIFACRSRAAPTKAIQSVKAGTAKNPASAGPERWNRVVSHNFGRIGFQLLVPQIRNTRKFGSLL